MIEEFTAVACCPSCCDVAVHWMQEPRLRPEIETPVEEAQRKTYELMRNINTLSISTFAGGTVTREVPSPYYDHPGSTVARVCNRCGYRWGQR